MIIVLAMIPAMTVDSDDGNIPSGPTYWVELSGSYEYPSSWPYTDMSYKVSDNGRITVIGTISFDGTNPNEGLSVNNGYTELRFRIPAQPYTFYGTSTGIGPSYAAGLDIMSLFAESDTGTSVGFDETTIREALCCPNIGTPENPFTPPPSKGNDVNTVLITTVISMLFISIAVLAVRSFGGRE